MKEERRGNFFFGQAVGRGCHFRRALLKEYEDHDEDSDSDEGEQDLPGLSSHESSLSLSTPGNSSLVGSFGLCSGEDGGQPKGKEEDRAARTTRVMWYHQPGERGQDPQAFG
ncbi:unnamed protein product [Staurois parvus]|uniref:Uncharacterized protein n=1 Tax=Staurois parvus TaxID=386267 RepID=A0ABN9G321_9NEOB|nr:unnamed protein product [Staurois parvus]